MSTDGRRFKRPRMALALRAAAPLVGVLLITFTDPGGLASWIGVGIALPGGLLVLGERGAERWRWRVNLPRIGTWIGLVVLVLGGFMQSAPLAFAALGGIFTCRVWLLTDLMR